MKSGPRTDGRTDAGLLLLLLLLLLLCVSVNE
jgi:hypothetical protein